jgi:hypothetical protein
MPNWASSRILLNKIRWFIYGKITSVSDFVLLGLGVSPITGIKDIDKGKKIIVYTGEFMPPRIPRIAKWSKKLAGFYTVLLCHEGGYFKKFSNEDVDQTFLFRNKWHLKRIIRALPQPYIMQGFAPKSKYPYLAMQFLKKYHPGTPFIADYQDVFAIYYGINPTQRWLKEELPYEKMCLQQANGIVAHSLEPCEGMKVWGIKEKGKRLFFPLYCDNDSFTNPKKPYKDDDIHLVYAGGVVGSHRDKSHYGDTQFAWLIDSLTQQKIHFHIYPSPSVHKADFEEYEQIAAQNSFFHFHAAVAQSALSQELSKYHYGLMPFFKGTSNLSALKLKYATTLKLFNYMEAGIPLLVGGGVAYQGWLVKRYKAGLVVETKEDFKVLRPLLYREPYDVQVKGVQEAREILSLKKHMPRLLKFYEDVQAASHT